ncbi:MAG: ABC transporter substrate-binding protein [Chloroflexia bacterium]
MRIYGRKYFLLIILGLCFGWWIGGCGTPAGTRTISFAVFGDPAELAAYESLVAAFESRHPDIDVQLRHVPGQSEYQQQLLMDFSAGRPPDVMLLSYRRFAFFAAQGGLEALEPYLARNHLFRETDFFPQAIEAFRWSGRLWCIPQNVSSLVVYYNQDLFDAAGLPYPRAGWTWDDFLDAARALTRDLDGDGRIDQYGAGISPRLQRLAPLIWQNGGELVDDPVHPSHLTLDSPAALAAFRWFVNLQVQEKVVPDAAAEQAESSESRFLGGRLAMYFNSRRGVPTYRTITAFRWDVAPLPAGREAASILHSDGFCMAAATQDKEAAWALIEFANSVEGQEILAKTGRTVPSLQSVAESPAFLEPGRPPASSRIFLEVIPTLRFLPILPRWGTIEEVADREIEAAFYGRIPVEEAVTRAISLTQPYFQEKGP